MWLSGIISDNMKKNKGNIIEEIFKIPVEGQVIVINTDNGFVKDTIESKIISHICSKNRKVTYIERIKDRNEDVDDMVSANPKKYAGKLQILCMGNCVIEDFGTSLIDYEDSDYFLMRSQGFLADKDQMDALLQDEHFYPRYICNPIDIVSLKEIKRISDYLKKPFIIMIDKAELPRYAKWVHFRDIETVKSEYDREMPDLIDLLAFVHAGTSYIETMKMTLKIAVFNRNQAVFKNSCYEFKKRKLYEIPATEETNSLNGAAFLGLDLHDCIEFANYWEHLGDKSEISVDSGGTKDVFWEIEEQ